jgi:hypothetical protein
MALLQEISPPGRPVSKRGATTGGENEDRQEQPAPAERPRMLYQKKESPQSGTKHPGVSPSSSDGMRKPSPAKSQLGKRLLVTALYLLAAPVLLYLVYDFFGLFPEEELAVGRRPGIIFILSHPAIILTSIACAVVPLLVYTYVGPTVRSGRLDKPFLALNIAAIGGSILLAAPMPFIPKDEYVDFLGYLGLPTQLLAEVPAEQPRPSKVPGATGDVIKSGGVIRPTSEIERDFDEPYLVRILNDCPHQISVWVRVYDTDYGYETYGPVLIDGNRTGSIEDEGEVVRHNLLREMGIYAEIVGKNLAWKIPKKHLSIDLGDRVIKHATMMTFGPHDVDGDFATYRLACKNLK